MRPDWDAMTGVCLISVILFKNKTKPKPFSCFLVQRTHFPSSFSNSFSKRTREPFPGLSCSEGGSPPPFASSALRFSGTKLEQGGQAQAHGSAETHRGHQTLIFSAVARCSARPGDCAGAGGSWGERWKEIQGDGAPELRPQLLGRWLCPFAATSRLNL